MSDLLHDGLPFTCLQLPMLGLSPSRLRRLVREHRVRRIFRGVYVDAAVADGREVRIRALQLVVPRDGVLFGCTATWALEVDTFAPADRFDLVPACVVPHGGTRCTVLGVRCVEGYLPPSEVMEVAGLRMTVPVRTASDLLRRLHRPYALAAADGLAHAGLVTPAQVEAYVCKLHRYPGVVQARELAVLIEPRAESAGESWQRLRLIDAGFPRPEPQYVVTDSREREVATARPCVSEGCGWASSTTGRSSTARTRTELTIAAAVAS